MRKYLARLFGVTFLACATLLTAANAAHAQRGHGGYHGYNHGGYYHGGYYHGGYYRPYGYYGYGYRPYYGIGFVGIGLYAPYYGSWAYPVAPGYAYAAYPPIDGYGPVQGGAAYGGPTGPQPSQAQPGQPPADRPPPDNAGHLQLIVPEAAEVFIDGAKINQIGSRREIVSPPVTPNARYTYKISVRYADANGKAVDDTREIHFRANDWFTIDFTRPAPPMAAPQLQPVPNVPR